MLSKLSKRLFFYHYHTDRCQKILTPLMAILVYLFVSPVNALSIDETRHLLTRSGFSPAPHEFYPFTDLTREEAVDRVISGLRQKPVTPAPSIIFEQFYDLNQSEQPLVDGCSLLSDKQTVGTPNDIYSRRYAEHYAMKRWWWTEMINTPSPLTERLTLMWHDHFATGFSAWAIPQFYNNQTLRTLGSTDFKALAMAMLRDPAMIYYLDNYKNISTHPNENLAREFLELFTMGEGNYSEIDIKEFAKVLAGHGFSKAGCHYEFHEDQAYKGEVTLMGKTGKFNLEEAVDIILSSPKVSEFIVNRFWVEFISPEYTQEQIQPLATAFREHHYDIKYLLKKIFLHDAFWVEENRGTLVKSPVELLVGMVRGFGIFIPDPDMLMADSAVIGQDLFSPPNVAGWKENDGWIDPLTIVLRSAALERLWNSQNNLQAFRKNNKKINDGLILLVSSKRSPQQAPRSIDISVNNKVISHFVLQKSDTENKKLEMGLIPEQELFNIPAELLPKEIKTVGIDYKTHEGDDEPGNYPQLMIHWIEYQNRRYSPVVAVQTVTNEKYKNMKTPLGLLGVDSTLIFNLPNIREHYQKVARDGRDFMAYNVVTPLIAELYTFGNEQPMPLLPAGMDYSRIPPDSSEAFKALAGEDDEEIAGIPLLAILPKRPNLHASDVDKSHVLQSLTYSLFYQLK